MYRIGDVVSVCDDRGEVSKLQRGHGEWVENMTEVHVHVHCIVVYASAQ